MIDLFDPKTYNKHNQNVNPSLYNDGLLLEQVTGKAPVKKYSVFKVSDPNARLLCENYSISKCFSEGSYDEAYEAMHSMEEQGEYFMAEDELLPDDEYESNSFVPVGSRHDRMTDDSEGSVIGDIFDTAEAEGESVYNQNYGDDPEDNIGYENEFDDMSREGLPIDDLPGYGNSPEELVAADDADDRSLYTHDDALYNSMDDDEEADLYEGNVPADADPSTFWQGQEREGADDSFVYEYYKRADGSYKPEKVSTRNGIGTLPYEEAVKIAAYLNMRSGANANIKAYVISADEVSRNNGPPRVPPKESDVAGDIRRDNAAGKERALQAASSPKPPPLPPEVQAAKRKEALLNKNFGGAEDELEEDFDLNGDESRTSNVPALENFNWNFKQSPNRERVFFCESADNSGKTFKLASRLSKKLMGYSKEFGDVYQRVADEIKDGNEIDMSHMREVIYGLSKQGASDKSAKRMANALNKVRRGEDSNLIAKDASAPVAPQMAPQTAPQNKPNANANGAPGRPVPGQRTTSQVARPSIPKLGTGNATPSVSAQSTAPSMGAGMGMSSGGMTPMMEEEELGTTVCRCGSRRRNEYDAWDAESDSCDECRGRDIATVKAERRADALARSEERRREKHGPFTEARDQTIDAKFTDLTDPKKNAIRDKKAAREEARKIEQKKSKDAAKAQEKDQLMTMGKDGLEDETGNPVGSKKPIKEEEKDGYDKDGFRRLPDPETPQSKDHDDYWKKRNANPGSNPVPKEKQAIKESRINEMFTELKESLVALKVLKNVQKLDESFASTFVDSYEKRIGRRLNESEVKKLLASVLMNESLTKKIGLIKEEKKT